VAGDYDSESSGFRFEIELSQVMQDVDRDAPEFDDLSLWQFARPRTLVDVAADRGQWSKSGELLENLRIADIPGVNDVLRPAERLKSFRSKQAVGIGDDADSNRRSTLPLGVLIRAHQLVDLGVGRRVFHHRIRALCVHFLREPAQQAKRCSHRART